MHKNQGNGHVCPLLSNPQLYQPDTIDLMNDKSERDYWLTCLEQMVKKFVDKANVLNPNNPNARQDAQKCCDMFQKLVGELRQDPTLLKPLSIRTLLEYNERTFRENNLRDAWLYQKEHETENAFDEFEGHIRYLDGITDAYERWLEIAKGMLAGNVFDWGSKAVTDILETSDFGFAEAKATIEKRPWFRDDLDDWIATLEARRYAKAVIFVDNAGVDFVLGVLPFVRELIRRRTTVVVAANTSPALNDVTYSEAKDYVNRAGRFCRLLKDALETDKLCVVENGQGSPCLDLSNLTKELCDTMRTADLIVLEGMGRAVHTNLDAVFNVDSLKFAVLKNERLAKSLGAQQFSVIFQYRAAS